MTDQPPDAPQEQPSRFRAWLRKHWIAVTAGVVLFLVGVAIGGGGEDPEPAAAEVVTETIAETVAVTTTETVTETITETVDAAGDACSAAFRYANLIRAQAAEVLEALRDDRVGIARRRGTSYADWYDRMEPEIDAAFAACADDALRR